MASDDSKGKGGQLSELVSLVVAYAKQETLGPVKSLGRYLLWGALGGLLLTIGSVLLALTAVRAVQAEAGRHLAGNWSWVPYMGGVLVALVVVGWAGVRMTKGDKAVQ